MKIDSAKVKKLRDDRSWSQEHLAEVTGLSLRTIQRVESEGSASPESRMAIASAFGFSPSDLAPPSGTGGRFPFPGRPIGIALGFGGATLGAALGCLGVVQGGNTASDAGIAFGVIGLGYGLTCGLIGVIDWCVARLVHDSQ